MGFDIYISKISIQQINMLRNMLANLRNAIIVAENQYAGVGKNSSHWWSSPCQSILATIMLSIDLEPAETIVYPLLVGVIIREVLAEHGG